MPRFDPKKFDKQTEKVINNIKKRLKETAYRAAEFTIQTIAFKYSPVWTGSYILSHRIGINGKNDSGPTKMGPKLAPGIIPPKVAPIVAEKYRMQAALRVTQRVKLAQMPDNGSLIMYNTSEHAGLVEMLPDKYVKGNMAPYYPYMKTNSDLREKIHFIIKQVERKYK
jgi:hypothetical protein